MIQIFLIGIAAGAATALLALAGVTGPSVAVILFVFAGLPILIASIGWSHWAGMIAVVAATLGLAAIIGWNIALPFAATIGLPAWWLGYLTLLARPSPPNQELEWYPVGGLVVWAALLAGAVVVFAIPFYGWDQESLHAALRGGMERTIRARTGTPADSPLVLPGVSDPQRMIDLLATLAPFISAAFGTVINLINLWLAAAIVRISARLRRPWPDLPAMRFHPYAFVFAAATFAGAFAPGIFGTIAGTFATTMIIACAVLGLAVVHTTSRGITGRGIILGAIYAALLVFGWTILLAAIIGLADGIFDLRGRVATRRGTPPVRRQ